MPDSPTSEPESGFLCDCEAWMRPACASERFYRARENKRYCVLHVPDGGEIVAFNAAIQKKFRNKDFNFQGVWFPEPPPVYSINFTEAVDFSSAFFSRGADFSFTTFSKKATFKGSTFAGAGAGFAGAKFKDEADFSHATFRLGAGFKNATFHKKTDFSHTTFHFGAIFESTKFCTGANFNKTRFPANAFFVRALFDERTFFCDVIFEGEADFSWAKFKAPTYFFLTSFAKKADFTSASFHSDVEFNKTNFLGAAIFRDATFENYLGFWGYGENRIFKEQSSADFQYARIENPHRVSFHTLRLRPHWFVNVDARKFEFINVDWDWRGISVEVESLEGKEVSSPHRLLAIACRHLAVNAEENHRYHEASRFRYIAMDSRQRAHWRGFAFWRLGWWYWLASGYGERVPQAFLVLLAIWFLAGLLYTRVGFARWEPKLASESDVVSTKRDDVGAPLKFSRALTYSAAVMTFQKPEPRPATNAAQTVVLLETILGPVQAALLALAIRRKFMR